jgi:hypothetical protein
MRNPADLPPELFTLVLDDVLAEESTVTQACHLLLIDHKWQRILLPRIYTKWTYDGAQHSFHSLWKFWLTVNRNPDISGSVETLVIGNWGFNEYETLGHDFDYTLETSDLDLMRAKIYTIGLQDHEETILKDLARGDRRPIMALLLPVSQMLLRSMHTCLDLTLSWAPSFVVFWLSARGRRVLLNAPPLQMELQFH